jgi:hypothetical protein
MVKKLPTKEELRVQLEHETRRYLDLGGEVAEVPQGATGNDPQKASSFSSGGLFAQPRSTRTFVPEVVAAIEERRSQRFKSRAAPKRTRPPKPRQKVLYDDFGEPIRTVWVDE